MITSVHFRERWIERFGKEPPGPEELDEIIRHSLKIHHQRTLYSRKSRNFITFRLLETWVNFDREIVIHVDRDKIPPVAVTLITGDRATWK